MPLGLTTEAPAAAKSLPRPSVGVGLFVLNERREFLLLQRSGSHGEGCWGLVGGHLEGGATPQQTAADEAGEEVGLTLDPALIALGPYTNDLFPEEGKHYITLYAATRLPAGQVPWNREPHKCRQFGWFSFDRLPSPLFTPVRNLLRQPVLAPFTLPVPGATTRFVSDILPEFA